ncbi:MAG: glycine cleavage system protein H [Candidatus Terraquivivens tikiterensis]|uniref:Probable glycine cleavage system H protein n=1 Tax=Candidatus Terraquivivens tikiterensis TaxID=1980982 RepID=A0A2R7YAH9_9ARCH|nr:MAG: glycine cleavage system protein H [Candidatus Terraquivivens tikiterensis]
MSEDFEIPEDLLYSKDHIWVKVVKKKIAVMGITDYAQKKLRDVIYLELPSVNQKLKQKDTLCTIESVKVASEIYTPISGKVIEVNNNLLDKPELVNDSPYEDGWIAKVEISDPSELERLMDAEEYRRYIEGLEEEAEKEE